MTTFSRGDAQDLGLPSWEECMELLDRLPALPVAARAEALQRLLRNASPGIRERALRLGAAILADDALVELLRDDADAVMRNAGLEILKMRGGRSYAVAIRLLRDADSDVVLQAVLILDHLRDPRALAPLRAALVNSDPNVVQGVILAIGRLGNAGSVPDLLPFLAADPWLQMAAVQALGDLRSVRAVRPLANLLTDLIVGPMAAEAVARIGGSLALRTLAAHWLSYGEQLDAASMLGLLAHVLEGLRRPPAEMPEMLLPSLAARLEDPAHEVRAAAARALLALGPSAWDGDAVAVLAAQAVEAAVPLGDGAPPAGSGRGDRRFAAAAAGGGAPEGRAGDTGGAAGGAGTAADAARALAVGAIAFPPALERRGDLAAALLTQPGFRRAWGVLLCARLGAAVPVAEFLAAAADAAATPELLPSCVKVLSRLRHAQAGAAILDVYLAVPADARATLASLLVRRRDEVRAALGARPAGEDLDPVDRLVVLARLGEPAPAVVAAILDLAPAQRVAAVLQLAGLRAVVRALPWQQWLREDPAVYAEAAAEAASQAQLRELLPALRELPAAVATPTLLRAFGELADRASVPVLLELAASRPALRALALESLGRIGGPEARAALSAAARAGRGGEARAAYRALTLCAAEEDEGLFRATVTHPDWYVRLLCVEVLGRFGRPENLNALARLAGDPVPAVASRALALLEG
jgi:HEAT repeat protein